MFKEIYIDHGYLIKNKTNYNINTTEFITGLDESYNFWNFTNNKLLSTYLYAIIAVILALIFLIKFKF